MPGGKELILILWPLQPLQLQQGVEARGVVSDLWTNTGQNYAVSYPVKVSPHPHGPQRK